MVVKQVCGIFSILGVLKEHINIVVWFVSNILLRDKYVYYKLNTDMV